MELHLCIAFPNEGSRRGRHNSNQTLTRFGLDSNKGSVYWKACDPQTVGSRLASVWTSV